MEPFFSRYRNLLVLVAVLLLQIIGLAVQVRRPMTMEGKDVRQVRLARYWAVSLVAPFERAFLYTGQGIRGTWNGYIGLRHVYQRNQELQAEMDRLRLEQSSLAEDARQGQRLQKLLGFKQQYIYQTVAAQVIGSSGTDQSRVLYLDKGAADGLRADMPVITPDGVVGKLRDVFPHTAQVLEINDQSSGLGIILEKTRLRGILRGSATGQPEIIDILPDERIQPGEPVITSGGDQVYPRGLPVGVVDRVVNDPERTPYVAVLVRPAANLSSLEEVLVITQIGNTLPATEAADIITSEQKAADILAQRLPGANIAQPAAGANGVGPDGQPLKAADPNAPPPPVQPSLPLHPDRFTPGATPPAADLVPGASYQKQTFPAQAAPVPAPQATPPTASQPATGQPTAVQHTAAERPARTVTSGQGPAPKAGTSTTPAGGGPATANRPATGPVSQPATKPGRKPVTQPAAPSTTQPVSQGPRP
jgi:rod shape-determining protein MreC